jgi:hypothetical protein
MPPLSLAIIGLSAAAASARAGAAPPPRAPLSSVCSATHWSPCYFLNASLPSLHDGAARLAALGTTSIKLILDNAPDETYPWNTDWPSITANVTDLASLAATPIWDAVFRGAPSGGAFGGGWAFDTFDLITYRLSSPTWNYWCAAFTAADAAAETAELAGLTAHLLGLGGGRTFVLEHWEGDWSSRCGSYDAKTPAAPAVQARMVQWLAARQAGVDAGRAAWCAVRGGRAALGIDCASGAAVHAAAGARVWHASEVNLVKNAMAGGFPDNILKVIPLVRLDMVSYSSYDTQWDSQLLPAALDFIAAHHNRTAAAPPAPAVFIAEFGIAQMEDRAPADALALYANVLGAALSAGPAGAPRAAWAFAWELFDNEHIVTPAFPGGRCNARTGPEFNASALNGFFLVRPDGSETPAYSYLRGIINGSAPAPPAPAPTKCTFVADTDVQNPRAGAAVAAASEAACCAACSDARCTAAVFVASEGACYTKFGGEEVAKEGVTLCRRA